MEPERVGAAGSDGRSPADIDLAAIYAVMRDAVSEAELDAAAAVPGGRRLAEIKRDRLTVWEDRT